MAVEKELLEVFKCNSGVASRSEMLITTSYYSALP